jgi:hypothetical protein
MSKKVALLLASLTLAYGARPASAQGATDDRQRANHSALEAAPPEIDHTPLKCVRVKENPLVKAGVTASAEIERSRVYFKAHQFPDWYYVDMRSIEVPNFLARLPQPLPETMQVDYYVQALDVTLRTSRTEEYGPAVTRGKCRRDVKLPKGFDEGIVVGATKEGQPPIPPGFSAVGIVAFVTAAGVTSALTAPSGAATGGGLSKTALIAAGGAAAGGIGIAALSGGEDEPECSAQMLVAMAYQECAECAGQRFYAPDDDTFCVDLAQMGESGRCIAYCIRGVCQGAGVCNGFFVRSDGAEMPCAQHPCATGQVPNSFFDMQSAMLSCIMQWHSFCGITP